MSSKIKYKSTLEERVHKRMLPKGSKYEPYKIPYVIHLIRNYTPDFIVYPKTKKPFVLEVKGYFRAQDRTKMLMVKESNPDLDIRFFFPVNNKIYAKSKTRYSDWCEKHGFPYAVGHFPKEWFT